MAPKTSWFTHFAQLASHITGRPLSFILAVAVILVWAVTGPLFGYTDTWQLVINTGTTIVTFLMVFVIQNTQNRDTAAMHIKLDELIRVSRGARNVLLDLEELEDKDLEGLRREYELLAEKDRSKDPNQSPPAAAKPPRKTASAARKKQT
ncbi:low affinity iron permease family protein [Methyloceanibacter superfactus]|jgi:low affinity Fe/Cu permease|uniref:low affinity iron permease family protein n=1 Tax=Methyloceanibacter superfactus TaxID=1774969 RepID=UPI000849DAF5|nr:low affinity iron permease family protein [Methyloceanibacter superfactus]